MYHHTYHQYEMDVAAAVQTRTLLREARSQRLARAGVEPGRPGRRRLRERLAALWANIERRLQPAEDGGYIA